MEENAEATGSGETQEASAVSAAASETQAASTTADATPAKDDAPDSTTTMDMEVPEGVYGWLAGPDGAHIQELERLAGAQIQALQPASSTSEGGVATGSPRRLQLSGGAVAVERARVLLEERLRSAPTAEGTTSTAAGSEAQATGEAPAPEEAEGRPAVTVAGRAFKDRDQLVAHVKALQASVTDGAMLGPEDAFFVFHLITYHPNFSEKMTAPLVGFKYGPHENFPGSKCFFMVRVDGSEEGISIMKCVDSVVPKRSRNETSGEIANRGAKRPREEEVAEAPPPARPRREIQPGCVLIVDGFPADIEYMVLREAMEEYGNVRFLEFIRSESTTDTPGEAQKASEETQGPDEDASAPAPGEEGEAVAAAKEASPPVAEDAPMETVGEGSKPVSKGAADAAQEPAAEQDKEKEEEKGKEEGEAAAKEGTATAEGTTEAPADAPAEAREKKPGATKARVRYADSAGASRALAELKEIEGAPVSLHLLEGDEEREFWERLWRKADEKQQGKGGKGKSKDSKGGKGKGKGKGKGGKGKGKKGKSW